MNDDAKIFAFNDARPSIVAEVVRRVSEQARDPLFLLNDAAYQETRRLAHSHGSELAEWRTLASSLGKMSARARKDRLEEMATRHAWDIAGNFDSRVYKFASKALAPLLGTLLSPRATLKNLPGSLHLAALDGRILVEGPREQLSRLARKGTLVYVPTHLSNLDSVVFGFALVRAGLPPATYGAGKNLFTNPVLSFFMHNLGAYRVDRRLKHVLYKDVLKTYSCVLIERGYHSLFFPGGTRSRSGGVEQRLKLGLAGTGLEAFVRSSQRGKTQPVFFVPATINYLLTLEAETLIDDFLQEEGKARYLIEDDESTRVGRVVSFMNKLLDLDGACVVRFAQPLDCFGNRVDDEGQSHDARGRRIDPTSLIRDADGHIARDPARDAEYTRELGEAIVEAFDCNTVVMPTHLVAAAAFGAVVRSLENQDADVFAILRQAADTTVSFTQLAADVEALRDRAASLHADGKIVLLPQLRGPSGREIIGIALRAFAGYHSRPVLEPRGDALAIVTPRVLYYYQNRLAASGLGWSPRLQRVLA